MGRLLLNDAEVVRVRLEVARVDRWCGIVDWMTANKLTTWR